MLECWFFFFLLPQKKIFLIKFPIILNKIFIHSGQTLKTACGSPCYAAPEMIAGKKYGGEKVDVWSCGVILYALICGYLPFEDQVTANLYKKIMHGVYEVPEWISDEVKEVMAGILTVEPEKRWKIEEVKRHKWVDAGCEGGETEG